MIARHRRHRRGWALIECLVLISVMTVLLGLCAGTIRLLMQLDRAGRAARDQAADVRRLSADFRADVHASTSTTPPPEGGDRLVLPLPAGRTAEYLGRATTIVRTIREGERVRRVESYRRPPRSTLRFEVAKGNPRPLATLILGPEPGGDSEPLRRGCRVEAELGKDHRFSARPK